MKKSMVFALILALTVFLPLIAFGATLVESGECGASAKWDLYDNGELIISGTGSLADYGGTTEVPWFGKNVTSITVQSGITRIGSYALSCNRSATSITLPAGITEIGDYGLAYNSSLQELTIPNGVVSIGRNGFSSSGLKTFTFPDSVTVIGRDAFMYCSALREVTLPAGLKVITDEMFFCCDELEKVVIPEGVTEIAGYVFRKCYNLSSITLPKSLEKIGDRAFVECTSLPSVTIPAATNEMGVAVFSGCSGLKKAEILGPVTGIRQNFFTGCSSMESVTLPRIQYVSAYAFNGCSTLKDVYFDGTETDRGRISFAEGNDSLEQATWHCKANPTPSNPPSSGDDPEDPEQPGGNPPASGDDPENPEEPANTTPTVGNLKYKLSGGKATVTGPKSRDVKKLTIPASIKVNGKTYQVTGIGPGAFKGMAKLTSVKIGKNVKDIGKEAFRDCAKLKTITIQTILLTKKTVKTNAFKGIFKKAVFKCPKGWKDTYRKILLKKGAPGTSKFK